MCRDGIKRFKTIAVIAATAIGDPSKYWIICGAALVTLLGKRTRAKVKMIGKPMMYRSDSPVCCWRMTFNPLSMIVTVMIAKTPPITGAGIAAKKADNLAKKPKTINQLPAAMKTRLEATPVMEITPALVE